MVNGAPAGAVITGQSGPGLIAFTSADGASWRQIPAFGTAATQDVSGVAIAQGGTVIAAGTTTNDPDSRQPLLTRATRHGPPQSVDIGKIPGAADPELAVNDVAAGNGTQVAVGSANGYPAAWISANGGTDLDPGRRPEPGRAGPARRPAADQRGLRPRRLAGGGRRHRRRPAAPGGADLRERQRVDRRRPRAGVQPARPVHRASGRRRQPWVTSSSATSPPAAAPSRPPGTSAGLTGWQRATVDSPGAQNGAQQMRAVTAGPHGFVAVGADGNAAAAWTSPNGQAWTQQNVPLPVGATRAVLQYVASNGRHRGRGRHRAHRRRPQLPFAASSADGGRTWTESTLPVPAGHASVTALTAAATGFGPSWPPARSAARPAIRTWWCGPRPAARTGRPPPRPGRA